MKGIFKRIRGWIGNALVWGTAWSLVTAPIMGVVYWLGYGHFPLGLATRVAQTLFAMGFLAGGTFSTYLAVAHRHKRFDELRPGRFAVFGGIFAGLLVPVFSLIPGLGMLLGGSFYGAVAGSVGLAVVLGGVTAFGTVKIAQNAALTSGSESPPELEPGVRELVAEEGS